MLLDSPYLILGPGGSLSIDPLVSLTRGEPGIKQPTAPSSFLQPDAPAPLPAPLSPNTTHSYATSGTVIPVMISENPRPPEPLSCLRLPQ